MTYTNLGIAYYMGEGVAKDYDKAIQYFQKAAKMGSAKAYNALGDLYGGAECETSVGVFPKGSSEAKAKEYFKKACQVGDEQGCEALKQKRR
ncbi:hypothetical protein ASB1_18140 (plasmid) [Helicobacter heilmannii]|nr:SEL1-like repeat protein [Helicobacter heilmannii]BDQ28138.1 hypothetical protein ASB1_18140 [Helicobacter heilmannii]